MSNTPGIETVELANSKYSYRFVLKWTDPRTGETHRTNITCESPYTGNDFLVAHGVPRRKTEKYGLDAAKAKKADYAKARDDDNFTMPSMWKKQNRSVKVAADAKLADRERLIYSATKKFNDDGTVSYILDGALKTYADDKNQGLPRKRRDVRAALASLARVGLHFNGTYLDEWTDDDTWKYAKDRTQGRGAYKRERAKAKGRTTARQGRVRTGAVSTRAAEHDWGVVQGFFKWLRVQRGDKALRAITSGITCPPLPPLGADAEKALLPAPKRTGMVATPAQLSAIFTAEKRAKGGREGKTWAGRELITDQHRALFRLCFETAARPSEPRRPRARSCSSALR